MRKGAHLRCVGCVCNLMQVLDIPYLWLQSFHVSLENLLDLELLCGRSPQFCGHQAWRTVTGVQHSALSSQSDCAILFTCTHAAYQWHMGERLTSSGCIWKLILWWSSWNPFKRLEWPFLSKPVCFLSFSQGMFWDYHSKSWKCSWIGFPNLGNDLEHVFHSWPVSHRAFKSCL